MIARIDWGAVPYYMITIKPVFGNLGKVIGERTIDEDQRVYTLNSVVDRALNYDFYSNEASVCAE